MIHGLNPHNVLLKAQSAKVKTAKYPIAAYDVIEPQVWRGFPTCTEEPTASAQVRFVPLTDVLDNKMSQDARTAAFTGRAAALARALSGC